MNVADYIAEFLDSKGVPAVFELSGGMIAFISDAIYRRGATPIICTRHEQAAGFAAEGATRYRSIPAVAMGTSGPGATNLITPIASCYFDSTPVIFLTGQVNQAELRKSINQRQNGFQELDIVSMVKGITKYAVQVTSVNELVEALEIAWQTALEGRPGPVLIDIPIDLQQIEVADVHGVESTKAPAPLSVDLTHDIQELKTQLLSSQRPLILVGGGIRISGSVDKFRSFVERTRIPVVTSLMGLDALPNSSPYKIGMIGSYGNRWANRALARSDVLIVLGSRLDGRQTGSSVRDFEENKFIYRVDIDGEELDGRIRASRKILSDVDIFFEMLGGHEISVDSSIFLEEIERDRKSFPQDEEQESQLEMHPNIIIERLSDIFSTVHGYVVDVGQHQMWAAQSLVLNDKQRVFTSGGLGAMGFAIPAAIGASIASSGKWVVITGDGCAQLSFNELQTIKQGELNIVICIFNNRQLGMVAQFQETNLDARYVSTQIGYSTPNFVAVAKSYGIKAYDVKSLNELEDLRDILTESNEPIVLEFQISQLAKALPKMDHRSSIQDL